MVIDILSANLTRGYAEFLGGEIDIQRGLRKLERRSYGNETAFEAMVYNRPIDVLVTGEITHELSRDIVAKIHNRASAPQLNLHIDSNGGNLDAACRILAAVEAFAGVRRANVQTALSAAFMLCCACSQVYARRDAKFLAHSPHVDGKTSVNIAKEYATFLNALITKHHPRVSLAAISNMRAQGERGTCMSSAEMQAIGFVNAVSDRYEVKRATIVESREYNLLSANPKADKNPARTDRLIRKYLR